MQTFWAWLADLRLLGENYYTFDPKAYDTLFNDELQKVISRTSDPTHRQVMQSMLGFRWTGYVAASVRHAGYRDQREVQERTHDVVVKLLTGTLFKGFDERTSGPMDRRFKNSVGNAVRNMVEKDRNRRHYISTISIDQAAEPSGMTREDDGGERVIRDFRRLVRRRLGDIGAAVLDTRLAGGETKSLVGSPSLGSPGKYGIKRTVQQLKQLAQEYALALGNPGFLRDIETAMGREEATIEKRRQATAAARQAVGV